MDRRKWTYPYQRWSTDRWLTLYFAVCYTGIILIVGAMVAWFTDEVSGWGWVAVIVGPLLGITIIFVQWRQVIAGVALSDLGVRVRTVPSTKILPWSEIRDFVADEADPGPWELYTRVLSWSWNDTAMMGMFIKLHDGRLIGTPIRLGVRPTFRTGRGKWTPGGPDEFLPRLEGQALLDAMRERLARETTPRVGPPR